MEPRAETREDLAIGTRRAGLEPVTRNLSELAKELGAAGGRARKRSQTAEQLSEQGRRAVAARWKKYRETHPQAKPRKSPHK